MTKNFNTTLLLAVLACSVARSPQAQTNRFFVTDDSNSSSEVKTNFSSKEIQQAQVAPECRPAKDDPEGHWGPVLEGFQLSVRFAKTVFTNGEPVTAFLFLRNVSPKVLWFERAWRPYEDTQTTVVLTRGGERLAPKDELVGTNFVGRVRAARSGSSAFWPCAPGTQRKFPVDLSAIFDLRSNGHYSVEVRRKVTNLDRTRVAEVVSGRAEFDITSAADH